MVIVVSGLPKLLLWSQIVIVVCCLNCYCGLKAVIVV